MFGPLRALFRSSLALSLACGLALGGPCGAVALAAEGTTGYAHESEADFAKQVAKKEVASVTINKRLREIKVTLKDGTRLVTRYPKKRSAQTAAHLQARGVGVTVLSQAEAEKEVGPKKTHHKIRYIVGGVLIVVIVLVGGFLLYRRRRFRD